MSDPDPDLEAMLARAMGAPQPECAETTDSGDTGVLHWLQNTLGVEIPAFLPVGVPPHVEEAFRQIFDRTRRALGAREADFVLGNVSLERDREGVRLEYRWRKDREETARCSSGGKSLTVTRYDEATGVRYTIRKHIHVDRDGTKISASDDRANRQIGEADCQAALEVFEAACRAVAPDKIDSSDDEAGPSDEA